MTESRFRKLVEFPPFDWQTGYKKKNMFLGSCFTENVGKKMKDLKYDVDINPFGILYNPVSVANGIYILLEGKRFSEHDLVQHNGLWHSFYHHSRFSSSDVNQTLNNINTRIEASSQFLKKADFLFITFGTAWVYKYTETGKTVSNCHKIPSRNFDRVRLSVDEIYKIYMTMLEKLWEINPAVRVVFTVSPVRHWKDGAVGNQRSKAVLLLAIDEIIRNTSKKTAYFPSYEFVMDELRDYRFYAEDMIHISDVAVNYIWEKFEMSLIEPGSISVSKEINRIQAAANHIPFNKFTIEHLKFLKEQKLKIRQLENKYPYLTFEPEQSNFSVQIVEIENKLGQI
jgi:hypothetical protein